MVRKTLLLLFTVGLAILLSHQVNTAVYSAQAIRLPFAPRYTYNSTSGNFAELRYSVSDGCANSNYHVNNAKYAVDFGSVPTGTPIYAPVSGSINFAGWNADGYGLLIKIGEGSDREHWLAHLSKIYVTSGQVDQGDLIALSGETGNGPPHLHYHVQRPGGTTEDDAIDVRGELPDIDWVDESDYCSDEQIDGTFHPSRIPNGFSNSNCAEFYNMGLQGVWGFDAPNCQGNVVFAGLETGDYNLASMRVNDRVRSISAQSGLNFWLYADTNSEVHKHCHDNDMWNLDTDNYNFEDVLIGWEENRFQIDVDTTSGVEMVSSGWNMASRIRVTTESCPANQGTRVSAAEISYGFGVGGGSGNPITPTWLLEFSAAEHFPLGYDFHVDVDWQSDFSAFRLCFDGGNCQETTSTELYYTWDTYGWTDGYHAITVQYRRTQDGGNWANALKYETEFYLNPNRAGFAPCGTGYGATLQSGSDCIRISESKPSLFEYGWSDRSNLSVTVTGNYEAWVFNSSNYEGEPQIVKSGETKNVGGNVSSIDLRPPRPTPPALPDQPAQLDDYTYALYHFDEGSGSTVYDAKQGLNGTKNASASWITGVFGGALDFNNATSGYGVDFGYMNFCPFAFEGWVRLDSNSVSTRLAGQLESSGGAPRKWLITYENRRPVLEVWSQTGSERVESYLQVEQGAWHYLIVSYNCSTRLATIYVNNEQVAQETVSLSAWPSGNTRFEIGSAEGSSHFDGAVDDVRLSNHERKPIHYTFDAEVTNPASGEVSAMLTWEGADYDWHMLYWGDGADFGMQNYSDSRVVKHNFSPGTYTLWFGVQGADDIRYWITDTVTIEQPACDSAVSIPGVTVFDFQSCATSYTTDHVTFLETGVYNLADYDFDNKTTSIHVPQDGSFSVRLYEGPNGTGQSVCRQWYDMWNMAQDYYPDQSVMDGTVSSIQVFDTVACTPPPEMSMTPSFLDPHGLIQLDVSWSGASSSWQMIDWGDNSDFGIWGPSGSSSPTHWYPGPGTYEVSFTVVNAAPDWGTYVITDTITVNSYSCGSGVTQEGVVAFRFSGCAYRGEPDYEQFTSSGIYNLDEVNNDLTSLHIPTGKSVRLFEGANATGESWCSNSDMWNMAEDEWPSQLPMNDTVSSLQIFENTTCTP